MAPSRSLVAGGMKSFTVAVTAYQAHLFAAPGGGVLSLHDAELSITRSAVGEPSTPPPGRGHCIELPVGGSRAGHCITFRDGPPAGAPESHNKHSPGTLLGYLNGAPGRAPLGNGSGLRPSV